MKKISYIKTSIVAALALCLLSGCIKEDKRLDPQFQRCRFKTGGMTTRSSSPDESIINDLNIFIFTSENTLERRIYATGESFIKEEGECCLDIRLLKGKEYNIFVCANLGYKVEISDYEELKSFRYHLAYPKDYHLGICMTGKALNVNVEPDSILDIELTRTMAKVSVTIDKSRLDKGIEWTISELRLSNCPKSVLLFGDSRADAVFANGYTVEAEELHTANGSNSCPYIDLYTFESIGNGHSEEKMQYIEMKVDYISEEYSTGKNGPLTYRFKISDDIIRNVNYRFRVIPEGDGMGEPGWDFEPAPYLKVSPGNLIAARVGDRVKIRCECYPSQTPFDIGLEELEHDRKEGIYEYYLDSDGMGVTLHCLKPGSGILYFTAGPPVNQEEMVLLVINPKQDS